MEMAIKKLCDGSQHESEDVNKEEGHDRDRRDVSEDMLAQKRTNNFLTFCSHTMLPKLLLLLTVTRTRTRLKQGALIQKYKVSKMKLP